MRPLRGRIGINMKNAIFTGSFDPITIGHYDIIRRAAAIFPKVFVAVTINNEKRYMFDEKERLEMVKKACESLGNVEILFCEGLVSKLAAEKDAVFVKGVRNSVDFAYEYEMASISKEISGVETFLIPADPKLAFVSSTFVREMIKHKNNPERYIGRGKN